MIWHVGQFIGQYHSLAISFLNTDPDITARILHAPSHTKLDAISGSTYVRYKDFDTYIPSNMLSIHGGPCAHHFGRLPAEYTSVGGPRDMA